MNLTVKELAHILAFGSIGLTNEGLMNYLAENERMVQNELRLKRDPRKYIKNRAAALIALQMRGVQPK